MRNDVKAVLAGAIAAATLLQIAAWFVAHQHWLAFDPLALSAPVVWRLPLIGLECLLGAFAGPIIWRLVRSTESAGYYVATIVIAAIAAVCIVAILTWLGGAEAPADDWLARYKAAALAGAGWGLGFALVMLALRALP